jgi:hypothetical protein
LFGMGPCDPTPSPMQPMANLYTPAVAVATAPGVPLIDPATGLPTGQTGAPSISYADAIAAAMARAQADAANPPADNRPWYCKYLGIGCDGTGLPGWAIGGAAVLAGLFVLNTVGGRR